MNTVRANKHFKRYLVSQRVQNLTILETNFNEINANENNMPADAISDDIHLESLSSLPKRKNLFYHSKCVILLITLLILPTIILAA